MLGRSAVGVEVEERYCEVIATRLAQGVLDFANLA
jgi:site-specific DNA-methyltransferase (adenine-specific)